MLFNWYGGREGNVLCDVSCVKAFNQWVCVGDGGKRGGMGRKGFIGVQWDELSMLNVLAIRFMDKRGGVRMPCLEV